MKFTTTRFISVIAMMMVVAAIALTWKCSAMQTAVAKAAAEDATKIDSLTSAKMMPSRPVAHDAEGEVQGSRPSMDAPPSQTDDVNDAFAVEMEYVFPADPDLLKTMETARATAQTNFDRDVAELGKLRMSLEKVEQAISEEEIRKENAVADLKALEAKREALREKIRDIKLLAVQNATALERQDPTQSSSAEPTQPTAVDPAELKQAEEEYKQLEAAVRSKSVEWEGVGATLAQNQFERSKLKLNMEYYVKLVEVRTCELELVSSQLQAIERSRKRYLEVYPASGTIPAE